MSQTIGRKVLHLVPVLFMVSLATFFMVELIPGDPAAAILGPHGTSEQYQFIHEELGVDDPLIGRYFGWLGDTLRGDLGQSLLPPSQAVSDMIRARLPVTLELALLATGMSLLFAIPMALLAARRAGEPIDRIVNGVAFGAVSLPSLLSGLLLVFFMVFRPSIVKWFFLVLSLIMAASLGYRTARRTRQHPREQRARVAIVGSSGGLAVLLLGLILFNFWPSFPRQGLVRLTAAEGVIENLRSVFLPSLTLAIGETAIFMRLLRADLLSTLQQDFILSARAKGMPIWRILLSDALRPSSFSLITVAGVTLGRLIGGTVIVETIFNLPGMGTLLVESITAKDFRVVQGTVLVLAVFFVLVNAAVDLSYAYLDPRIRRA